MAASSSEKLAEKTKTAQATWPDFMVSLYDKLTGKGAEITYEFQDFSVHIPAKLGENPGHFHWKIDGTLNIRTSENIQHEQNGE